jgi:hypothetical protein
MLDKEDHTIPSLPVANYASAIARAVEWLGDRYLLATPINTPLAPRHPLGMDQHRKDIATATQGIAMSTELRDRGMM